MFMASKTGYLDRAQVDTASLFTILRFLRGIHSAWSSARPKKTNRILQFHGNNNLLLQKKILNGFLSLYLEVHFQLQVDILVNYIYNHSSRSSRGPISQLMGFTSPWQCSHLSSLWPAPEVRYMYVYIYIFDYIPNKSSLTPH